MRQQTSERVALATAETTPRVAPARLGYVDGLRALAALYVVANHIGKTIWSWSAPAGPVAWLANALGYGHYAVTLFIVLSGFSLMLPVARNNNRIPWGAWGFYVRRARRILPPFYFAMGLALGLIWLFIGQKTGTFWDINLPVTWRDVARHALLINDFALDGNRRINYVFWSVEVECQIYVLFPALVLLWRRYHPIFSMTLVVTLSHLAMIVALLAGIGYLNSAAGAEYLAPYTGLFAMGMFAASVYTAPTPRWNRLRAGYLWELVALAGFVVIVLRSSSAPLYALDLCVGVMTVGLLLAASRPGRVNPVRTALAWRPLVWVGGFSYSIYLIHLPLIQFLWQYVFHPLGLSDTLTYLALLLLGGPLIVAAAWVFWYGCERPFLNSRPTATSPLACWPLGRQRLAQDVAR